MKPEIQVAHNVCELIKETSYFKNRRFNQTQKIKFAYKYWLLNPEDITELYESLALNNSYKAEELARVIGDFMDQQGLTSLRRFNVHFFDQDIETIQNTTSKIRENGNWLSLYNVEKEFTPQGKLNNPIIYSYLTQNGSLFKIDQERANHILGILTEENIPTAKCIVTGSFKDYANGNIDKYIKTLKKIK